MTMKKQFIIAIGLVLIPFAYAIYLYPTLPAKIPMHFNLNGEVDGWGSRESIYLLPSIMGLTSIFVYFIMANIKKIDPKRYASADDKVYAQFGLFTVVFLTCLSMVILYSTVHRSIDMNKMIFPLLGFAFTGMGIYMPKLKQNYIAGFKLPWTLENEANWNATHALAGKVWTMGGSLQVISAFLLNGPAIFIAFMSITAVMVIIPSVFSYRMFKRGNPNK
jgi:uncharacterized membrane protein